MNKTLLKVTTRSGWLVWTIFLAIMLMYKVIIISMFDPDDIESIMAMLEVMPSELVAGMGFAEIGATLTSFIAGYFYNFLAIMFPLIFCIIMGNRLVAAHVDSGSMAYLLATPNSRIKIIVTQAFFFLSSIVLLFVVISLAGILISESFFPGLLEIKPYLMLNLATTLIIFTVSGICFFFSSLFNTTGYSLALGGGIPVLFFVFNMVANMGDEFAWLGYFTVFSLFNPLDIISGDFSILSSLVLPLIITLLLYGGSIIVFDRRSLPL